MGFYTKYGDGGVDISPIGDLMKSEVYELAKDLGVVQRDHSNQQMVYGKIEELMKTNLEYPMKNLSGQWSIVNNQMGIYQIDKMMF